MYTNARKNSIFDHHMHRQTDKLYQPLRRVLKQASQSKQKIRQKQRCNSISSEPKTKEQYLVDLKKSQISKNFWQLNPQQATNIISSTYIPTDFILIPTNKKQIQSHAKGKKYLAISLDVQQKPTITQQQFNRRQKFINQRRQQIVYDFMKQDNLDNKNSSSEVKEQKFIKISPQISQFTINIQNKDLNINQTKIKRSQSQVKNQIKFFQTPQKQGKQKQKRSSSIKKKLLLSRQLQPQTFIRPNTYHLEQNYKPIVQVYQNVQSQIPQIHNQRIKKIIKIKNYKKKQINHQYGLWHNKINYESMDLCHHHHSALMNFSQVKQIQVINHKKQDCNEPNKYQVIPIQSLQTIVDGTQTHIIKSNFNTFPSKDFILQEDPKLENVKSSKVNNDNQIKSQLTVKKQQKFSPQLYKYNSLKNAISYSNNYPSVVNTQEKDKTVKKNQIQCQYKNQIQTRIVDSPTNSLKKKQLLFKKTSSYQQHPHYNLFSSLDPVVNGSIGQSKTIKNQIIAQKINHPWS